MVAGKLPEPKFPSVSPLFILVRRVIFELQR